MTTEIPQLFTVRFHDQMEQDEGDGRFQQQETGKHPDIGQQTRLIPDASGKWQRGNQARYYSSQENHLEECLNPVYPSFRGLRRRVQCNNLAWIHP